MNLNYSNYFVLRFDHLLYTSIVLVSIKNIKIITSKTSVGRSERTTLKF